MFFEIAKEGTEDDASAKLVLSEEGLFSLRAEEREA